MKIIGILFLTVFVIGISSCNSGTQGNNRLQDTSAVVENEAAQPSPRINVVGSSALYENPSDNSSKLINEKATRMTGETEYMNIDGSCIVEIIEHNGEWVKVHVVSPDWLSATHTGWVKKSILDLPENALEIAEEDYKVLKSEKQGDMTTYYVYYKGKDCSKENLPKVAKALKEKLSPEDRCNLNLYDTDKLGELITKYPIKGQEYLNVADHYLYMLDFEGSGSFYPFQDIQYKEYGGKNWKKDPL